MAEEYKYNKDVVTKTVNGEDISYYSTLALKNHAKVNPRAYEAHKGTYVKVLPGWYIQTMFMTKGKWANIAGLKVFDWAIPVEWQRQHQSELNKRGGAVWWYDNDKRWGEPLYFDAVKKMAMSNIKKQAPRR